jgi:hypothetical protein
MNEKDLKRFTAKIDFSEGCWFWKGTIDTGGYGRFMFERRSWKAHRVSIEHYKNMTIPKGLTVDHLCRVRHCVNPEHLEIVTGRENTLRGIGPSAMAARQGFCKRGHQLGGDNVHPGRTDRSCKACHYQNYLRRNNYAQYAK